jgi:hypothetical protein
VGGVRFRPARYVKPRRRPSAPKHDLTDLGKGTAIPETECPAPRTERSNISLPSILLAEQQPSRRRGQVSSSLACRSCTRPPAYGTLSSLSSYRRHTRARTACSFPLQPSDSPVHAQRCPIYILLFSLQQAHACSSQPLRRRTASDARRPQGGGRRGQVVPSEGSGCDSP